MDEDVSEGCEVRLRKTGISKDDQDVIRKTLLRGDSDFIIGSDLEDEDGLPVPPKKNSHVIISDECTVFCDEDDRVSAGPSTPLLKEASPTREYEGFFSYFWNELTRGYSLDNDQRRYTEKRRKLYTFLRVPYEVECFLFYGQMQCIDAFCYLFTFLPIRFFMSITGFLFRLRPLSASETCDVLKVGIMFFASLLMQYIDTSVVYHEVRSQGVIKLYIFYNMLEVFDKLFSSLGQDILDALFWTANERREDRQNLRALLYFTIAVAYATVHTFLVLLQATTLNVAFNSHTQALLAIMMSNNFVELKGSVFKKFAKANLFQMACSDVRERFHIMALIFVVVIRNMFAVNWSGEHFGELLPDIMMVVGAELLVDWLKHAFITKFNEINAEVYSDFTITISYDVVKSREADAFSDYSDQVSRRMGFIPIPLSVMLIRVLTQTFSFTSVSTLVVFFLAWLLLLAVKIFNGIIMLGKACQHVAKYKELQKRSEYELYRKKIVDKKSKSAPNSPRMSLIDFTDVLHQPAGVKGFTVSDIMCQLEDLARQQQTPKMISERRSSEKEREERTPRRAHSYANLPRERRDKSEPPASIPESDERLRDDESVSEKDENITQPSPKKKPTTSTTTEYENLADVTAYTMLPLEQGVQRIE